MIEFRRSTVCFDDGSPRRPSVFTMPSREPEGRSEGLPRVLVVDDERLLANTTADILRRAGFDARTAYGGFEALETMATFHPDCVLTDIVMPAMNGVELAIAVTRMYPAVKIMLYSGQAGIGDILEESRTKGFEFPLLAKPVHPAKLVEEITRLKNPKNR